MSKNLYAKKSLGQHFLKSKPAIRAMVESPAVVPGDIVVEIGPGKGVLTRAILDAGATVIAFELDERMIDYLAVEFKEDISSGKLCVIHQDILEVKIEDYVDDQPYKMIANIPYYITSMILRRFLETDHQPTDICILIQKEVAERIVARDDKQSLLSLSVQTFGTAKYVMKVARKYFSPPPKVESAIVHISDIGHHHFETPQQEKDFFVFLHQAFAHKRKQLMRNLKSYYDENLVAEALVKLDLPKTIRAEDIIFKTWLELFKILT